MFAHRRSSLLPRLGHLTPPAPPSHAPAKDTGLAAQTSSRNVIVIAAGGGVLLIVALIAWLIIRSRRTPQSGTPPHMTSGPYPPQQPPAGYHPYPNGAPQHGYAPPQPNPYAPQPPQPNPYGQQPPYPGQ
ncbi:hypothetical protein [Streptomyces nigra]|uniref:hypothetical protein n=1 Tax=Streptomyces nigra TaxID=1827580 RepID=UPI003421F40B